MKKYKKKISWPSNPNYFEMTFDSFKDVFIKN